MVDLFHRSRLLKLFVSSLLTLQANLIHANGGIDQIYHWYCEMSVNYHPFHIELLRLGMQEVLSFLECSKFQYGDLKEMC